MRTNYIHLALFATLSLLLAGCGRDTPEAVQPQAAPPPPAEAPPPPGEGETIPAPSGEVPPADAVEPAPSPPPPPAETPPPSEPSAVPTPTALAAEPSLDSMRRATPGAKISVPVDLRYSFDGAALPNQPVTLHLAAVPRVTGTRLHVSVKPAAGLQVAAGAIEIQKASATTAYRQQLSVTRAPDGPASLRVLVTMEMPEGNGFGYFTIPLEAP